MNKDQFDGAAQDVAGKLQQMVGMAARSPETRAHGVGRELTGKAQHAFGDVREAAADIAGHAREALDGVQDRVHDALQQSGGFYDRAREDVRHGGDLVQQQVERYPLASLLAAGAAGLLVGLLVNLRR